MSDTESKSLSKEPSEVRSLLLWPALVIVLIQWLVRFVLPVISPEAASAGVLGGLVGGLALIIWWAFFSRAHKYERWGAVLIMTGLVILTSHLVDESIRTGMQGMMFYVYCIPVLSLAFVVWVMATARLRDRTRCLLMIITLVIACGGWTLLRCDGITGSAGVYFSWRWSETPEDKLLGTEDNRTAANLPADEVMMTEAEWPGFRGPWRDGIVYGVQIGTDWTASPPEKLWSRQVGPGCSSFAVQGGRFYTQEQRSEYESVSCYSLNTGELLWIHGDSARFWDSHAGAGPRSTPTLHKGRVYTFGATGILNALNAVDGSLIWSRRAENDTPVELPPWGFTSSPLVAGDRVIIAFAGSLAAYDINTGDPVWSGPDGGSGYSSPHLVNLDGVEQVLLQSKTGLTSLRPSDGKLLWEHAWEESDRIVQPAVSRDGEVLLISGYKGTRRITVERNGDSWITQEQWTSTQLKGAFNDLVLHEGHAYGYIGPGLTCLNLQDGQRKWKGGRYGGQIILLAEQDLILVITEKGELALVKADPGKFKELARIPAIEGKTWNHPVMAGGILLVRNTEEMAAFRLERSI